VTQGGSWRGGGALLFDTANEDKRRGSLYNSALLVSVVDPNPQDPYVLAFLIWIRHYFVPIWIRILPSTSKKVMNLDFYCFLIFLSLRADVNVPLKSNKQNSLNKKTHFLLASCQPLTSRIRSRIRIRKSVQQICGSGSAPKCHGSTTLLPVRSYTV
jgi:hypothetical protein